MASATRPVQRRPTQPPIVIPDNSSPVVEATARTLNLSECEEISRQFVLGGMCVRLTLREFFTGEPTEIGLKIDDRHEARIAPEELGKFHAFMAQIMQKMAFRQRDIPPPPVSSPKNLTLPSS